jgi:hypothetical protein
MILRGAMISTSDRTLQMSGDQFLETNEADRTTGTIDAYCMPDCLSPQSRR